MQLPEGEVVKSSAESVCVEEQVKEFRDRFQTLFNLMPDPVVIVDGKGKFLAVNDRVAEKTGFKREELLGKNFLRTEIVTAKSKVILLKNLAKRMMGIYMAPYETEVLTKDGRKLRFEINARKIEYEGRTADLVIFRDVTERRKAEELYRSVVELSPESILTVNTKGVITSCNIAATRMLGYSRDEMVGNHFSKIGVVRVRDLPKYLKLFSSVLGGKVTKPLELTFYHKDGTLFLAEVRVSLLRESGKTIGLQAISRDITERKKMEQKLKEYMEHLEEKVEERTRELKKAQEQLLKSERLAAIGELATMVGHDLRNPLQSIENATYYLNNELAHLSSSVPIPKEVIEMLQVISHSVDYADKIIRDLHDFSGAKKPRFEKIDINVIVKDALSQVEVPENVELIIQLGSLPEIEVDKDMMKRIFLNLAINGIQAMEDGGTLKVSTRNAERFVEIRFEDTGAGIPKENMEKIFSPFFTTRAKGMGMGLPICKRFVDAHGGSIKVESREGKGSAFAVKLHIRQ